MSVMFALHSKIALSDILDGVISKQYSLACLVLSFFLISALTLLVMQFTTFQVFGGVYHLLYL